MMVPSRRALAALCLLLVVGAPTWSGCGSSSDEGGGEGGDETQVKAGADGACSAYASAYCQKLAECDRSDFEAGYASAEQCASSTKRDCVKRLTGADINAEASDFSACASKVSSFVCQPLGGLGGLCPLPAGNRGKGSACAHDLQCQSRKCSPGVGGCGVCADPALAAEGAACDGVSGPLCASGLSCSLDTKTCVRLGAEGDECAFGSKWCVEGLTCLSGVCGKPRAKGEPCSSLFDCGYGLSCDKATKVCGDPAYGAPGEVCTKDGKPTTLCRGGSDCDIVNSGGAISGRCLALGDEGQPCASPAGDYTSVCVEGLSCVDGTCKARPPLSCR